MIMMVEGRAWWRMEHGEGRAWWRVDHVEGISWWRVENGGSWWKVEHYGGGGIMMEFGGGWIIAEWRSWSRLIHCSSWPRPTRSSRTRRPETTSRFDIGLWSQAPDVGSVQVQCSKRMRLMMSSTATLPPPVSHQWRNVTGESFLPPLHLFDPIILMYLS